MAIEILSCPIKNGDFLYVAMWNYHRVLRKLLPEVDVDTFKIDLWDMLIILDR